MIAGLEDGAFTQETPATLLVAVLMKDGVWIEDVKIKEIVVDGLDATEKALQMLEKWNFQVVMLAGVSFAGFNLIDPMKIIEKFGKPIIIVARSKPDNVAVKRALMEHFKDWKVRWQIFKKLGPVYQFKPLRKEPPIYFEVLGAQPEWAEKIIEACTFLCRVPEPVRVARIIARGLTAPQLAGE